MDPIVDPGAIRLQILSHIAASAGAVEYTFELLSAEHGLSQMSVHDLAQDAEGEVWVATQAGLDLYDGVSFRGYGLDDGLASDDVRDIELAPDGEVWLGLNGYLAHGGVDGFTSIRAPGGPEVLSVVVGAAGEVWCGTSRGLLRWDGQRFEEIVPDVAIARVTRAADGIWLASARGVARIEDGRAAAWIPGTEGALDVALDRAGAVWSVGNFGLVVIRDGVVVERRPDLPGFRVHQDRGGDMWIGGVEQIARIHGEGVTRFRRTEGFPLDAAEAVLEDAEGLLWFGGFGGIAKFVGRPFATYGTEDGLPSANVRPIVRARDGALWVGTHSGAARQGRDGRFVPIDEVDGQIVMSLAEDPDGVVWIGTAQALYAARGGAVEQRLSVDVEKLVITPDRALWAVSSAAGLLRAPPGGDFEPVVVPDNERGARTRLLVTRDGALWFGGARGLSRFDGARWETFTTADGLASDEVYHLAEDGRGHLWFGYSSSRGLTRFDGWRFRTWTTADGLSSDAVYSIGVDGEGAVWVGTARGVDRFDGERFRNYGPPEGYASYESNAHGFWADPDGTLWFGTLGGLSRYDPSQDLPLDRPPRIELAEVLLGGEPPRQGLDWRRGELTALLHVHSSAPLSRTELRYRLVGLGGDWRPLDGHSLRVARLPAGAYRLEVQARRYGGPWSEPATAAFSILAPWWRQPAFAVLAAGIGALGLWGAVRLRLRGDRKSVV